MTAKILLILVLVATIDDTLMTHIASEYFFYYN